MKQRKPMDEFTRKRMLRQRRIRKRRLFIGFVFFLILLVAVGVVLSLTVLFPIQEIRVTGSEKYTEKQVVEACGILPGDNLFMASQTKCQKRLRQQLPYVESVKLEKELTGILTIAVADAQEYAAIALKGDYYIISPGGTVLDRRSKAPKKLVTVTVGDCDLSVGEQAVFPSEKTGELLEQLLALAEQNALAINSIDISDELSITIKVEGRFSVNLGTTNYLENKIKHLKGMIKAIAPEKTGSINLSMWTSDHTQGTFVEEKIE